MNPPPLQARIFVVGTDERLNYLFARYAELGGVQISQRPLAPQVEEIIAMKPIAVIFSALEFLESSQRQIEQLPAHEIPVLACVALADEARARELGAETCLVHPLTYENFAAALSLNPPEKPQLIRLSDKKIQFLGKPFRGIVPIIKKDIG